LTYGIWSAPSAEYFKVVIDLKNSLKKLGHFVKLNFIITSKMSDLGRKSSTSYPIQTSDYVPHSQPLPDEKVDNTKGPFPASIRAVKDELHANNEGRTVVICLDGTGDSFDNDNSNVVHFVSCLKKHEPTKQVTYYQSGIGTYGKGGIKNGIGAAMDMAVGRFVQFQLL